MEKFEAQSFEVVPLESSINTPEFNALAPIELLNVFRSFAISNPRSSRGVVAPEHNSLVNTYITEADPLINQNIDYVLERTLPRKKDKQIKEFSKSFVTAVRFIGLTALRNEGKVTEFKQFQLDSDIRAEVLEVLMDDAIETSKHLSDDEMRIAPSTWGAIKPHFRNAESVKELVEKNKHYLGLSFVVKALKDMPHDPERQIQRYKTLISSLVEHYPGVSIAEIRTAIIRKPKNPRELLDLSLARRKTNSRISLREAMAIKPPEKSTDELVYELKRNPLFKNLDVPNFVFRHAAMKNKQRPEEYLEWFIETRQQFKTKYPDCPKDMINTALTSNPNDPEGYLIRFIDALKILSEDPDYAFLAKREKYRYARDNSKNYQEILAEKVEWFKKIMKEPLYKDIPEMSIRIAIRSYENPEHRVRYLYLKRRFRKLDKEVIDKAILISDDLAGTIKVLRGHQEARRAKHDWKPVYQSPTIHNLEKIENMLEKYYKDLRFMSLSVGTIRRALLSLGPEIGEKVLLHFASKNDKTKS